MDADDGLKKSLEERFGLRNIRSSWIRRQAALSPEVIAGPICRADICEISEGTLPWNVLEAHSVQLGTKVLVQIEDVINIASSDPRSKTSPAVLQLTITDGCTDFVAVELESLQRISLITVPGTKIVLHPTAMVRRGRVLLTAKDFTYLGPPSSNIWGDRYDEKIASTLASAGLPNPKTSTFDSISRDATQSGAAVRLFPDLGGISDAKILANGNDEDDEEFWAEAAELADITQLNTNAGRRNGSNQGRDFARADRNERSAEPIPGRTTAVQGALTGSSIPSRRTNTNTRRPSGAQSDLIVLDISSDEDVVPMEIPEMPPTETEDPDKDESRTGTRFNNVIMDSEEMDVDELREPDMPLSRLEDLRQTETAGRRCSVYRTFISKPVSRRTTLNHRGKTMVSVPFDDGTSIENLYLDECTVRALMTTETLGRLSERSKVRDVDTPSSQGSQQLHRRSRGVVGFIEVLHDDIHSVTNLSETPPQGFTEFLSAYADNVEVRLAKHLVDEAR